MLGFGRDLCSRLDAREYLGLVNNLTEKWRERERGASVKTPEAASRALTKGVDVLPSQSPSVVLFFCGIHKITTDNPKTSINILYVEHVYSHVRCAYRIA